MKNFKIIRKNINENAQSFGGSVFSGFNETPPRSALNDEGLFNAFKNKDQLSRVNNFINSFLSGSYLDPKEALKELSGKLLQAGLVLNFNNRTKLNIGTNIISIKVFGDKFGVTPDTDLTKEPFDTGSNDYPGMLFHFNLVQNSSGFVFVEPKIIHQDEMQEDEMQEDEMQEDEIEEDEIEENEKNIKLVKEENEEKEKKQKEYKDPARVIELFLSTNADGRKRILNPIYNSLSILKKKGKYTEEEALKRFSYAVESGKRALSDSGKSFNINDKDMIRIAKRLLINFEKHIRSEK